MSKTSIHIEPCKIGSSERHNQRLKHLDYVRPELSKLNESWVDVADLPAHLNDLKTLVKDKTGRAMQAKATPIREGVIVIKEDTSIEQLRGLATAIEQRWGIKTLQIHIHRDEGYLGERTEDMKHREGKYNLHAHMFFVTTNLATGKSWKRQRGEGSVMQDITAQTLNLTRGVRKSEQTKEVKETLNAIQYKTQVEAERLKTLKEQTALEEERRAQAQAGAKANEPLTIEELVESLYEWVEEDKPHRRVQLFVSDGDYSAVLFSGKRKKMVEDLVWAMIQRSDVRDTYAKAVREVQDSIVVIPSKKE